MAALQLAGSAQRHQQLKRIGQAMHVATGQYMAMTFAQLKGMADQGIFGGGLNDAEQMAFYLSLKRKAIELLRNKQSLYEQAVYRVQQGSHMPGDNNLIARWPTWQAHLQQTIAAAQMNFQHFEQAIYGETFSLGGWDQ